MKLISWNVNGIRACLEKGFKEFFQKIDADIFCIQETKCQPEQVDLEFEGYKSYWNSAQKKGYSGTAIFTKIKPTSISMPWIKSVVHTARKPPRNVYINITTAPIASAIW